MTNTPSRKRFRWAVVCLTTLMRLRKRKAHSPDVRRKKALLIGANYSHNAAWLLKGPVKDVKNTETVLHKVFGFKKTEITTLSDDRDERFKATQANILQQLEEFVIPNEENVDYIFIFSGHAHQFKAQDPENGEEDDLSECILPCDAVQVGDGAGLIEEKVIFDYDLKKLLVKRLGPGSQLVAMFDSCHSATLLNLKHHKCNRLRRWTSPVRHFCRRYICDPLGRSLVRVSNLSGGPLIPYKFSKLEYEETTRYQESDYEKGMCTGFCCRSKSSKMPRAYCISACKDKETIFENRHGGSMVDSILRLLQRNPTPTFRQLMTAAHDGAQEICEEVKQSRAAEVKDCSMLTRPFRRAAARKAITRWNPEISSTVPLNMDATLILCELPSSPPIMDPRSLPA